jgi:hypothetical protein
MVENKCQHLLAGQPPFPHCFLGAVGAVRTRSPPTVLSELKCNDRTVEMIEERLAEAADVLRRLPEPRVQGYFNTWPRQIK